MEEVYRLSGGWSVLLIQTPFTLFSLMIYDNRIRTFSLYSGYPETIMSEMPELSRTLQVNCISISCWMLVMWAVSCNKGSKIQYPTDSALFECCMVIWLCNSFNSHNFTHLWEMGTNSYWQDPLGCWDVHQLQI